MDSPVEIRRSMQRLVERVDRRDYLFGSRSKSAGPKRYIESLGLVVPRAVAQRHEPIVVLRDGDEVLFGCARCDSYGYARTADEMTFGGDLFDRECPHDTPPRATLLMLVG